MDAKGQWITLCLMLAFALSIIASDVWLMSSRGANATYSRVTATLLDQYPVALVVVVFAIGVLVGHVLLPANPR